MGKMAERMTNSDIFKAWALSFTLYAALILATLWSNKNKNSSSPIIPDLNGNHFIAVTDTIPQFYKDLWDTLSSWWKEEGKGNKLIWENTSISHEFKKWEQDTSASVAALFADLENNKENSQQGSGTINIVTLLEENKKAFEALFSPSQNWWYHSKDAKRPNDLSDNPAPLDAALTYIITHCQDAPLAFWARDLTPEQKQQLETAGRTSQGNNTFVRSRNSNDITSN